jgi:hypothetical protein
MPDDPPFTVGDRVCPAAYPDLPPKPITEVVTTFDDDFATPRLEPLFVVNDAPFPASELVMKVPASGRLQEDRP